MSNQAREHATLPVVLDAIEDAKARSR